MGEYKKIVSIRVRLRRTTQESLFVHVPLTEDLWKDPNADGSRNLDGEKVIQRGVEIGRELDQGWELEDTTIIPHPWQS